MLGLLGKKVGMTQVFINNEQIPVSVIKVGDNFVLQRKKTEQEGYSAVQIGYDEKREKNTTKAMMGVFKKAGTAPLRFIREFRVSEDEELEVGSTLNVSLLKDIKYVDITGTSKGKGFQGVMKRHNFGGNRKTHGVSRAHRSPGSIGQSAYPSKVIKGLKMAGRMGNEKVTVQNLELVKVDEENGLLLIKGAVPGAKSGYLVIKPAVKK